MREVILPTFFGVLGSSMLQSPVTCLGISLFGSLMELLSLGQPDKLHASWLDKNCLFFDIKDLYRTGTAYGVQLS